MATHAANSLISDLAEMVQAVEALPQVQAQLDQVTEVNTKLATTIEARDAHIKSLQDAIDALQASLKSTEANRDDAELRFLELEDRVGKLTSAFALAHQNVAMANAVATEVQGWLKPEPKPEPQPEPEAVVPNPTELTAVPSTADAISAPSSVIPSENATSGTDMTSDVGVSVPTDPTASMTVTPSVIVPSPDVEGSGVVYGEGVSVPADPTGALPDVSVIEQASVSSAASEPTTASTQAEWRPEGPHQLPLSQYAAPIPTSTPEVAASANGSASPSADAGGEPGRTRYLGKVYSEVVDITSKAGYISQPDWEAGGGSPDAYWR